MGRSSSVLQFSRGTARGKGGEPKMGTSTKVTLWLGAVPAPKGCGKKCPKWGHGTWGVLSPTPLTPWLGAAPSSALATVTTAALCPPSAEGHGAVFEGSPCL